MKLINSKLAAKIQQNFLISKFFKQKNDFASIRPKIPSDALIFLHLGYNDLKPETQKLETILKPTDSSR